MVIARVNTVVKLTSSCSLLLAIYSTSGFHSRCKKTCIAISMTISETTSCYLPSVWNCALFAISSNQMRIHKKFHTITFLHCGVQDYYINVLQFNIVLQLVNSTLML